MLVAGPVASAGADAKLRLVNARPGSEPIRLEAIVGSQRTPAGGATEFGGFTPYASVTPGETQLALTGGTGSNATADVSETLEDGARYTVVALARGEDGLALKVFKDADAAGGKARLRVIHAAPELGSPDIRLGKRTIAEDLAFRAATPYLSVDPGGYELSVVRPGGDEAIFADEVTLSAGSASTAVVAGSGGAEPQVILATDDTVTPAAAPQTGFGGLAGDDGSRWLAAALAALAAGALGGGAQLARVRRGRR
jgi:hypothetical protein